MGEAEGQLLIEALTKELVQVELKVEKENGLGAAEHNSERDGTVGYTYARTLICMYVKLCGMFMAIYMYITLLLIDIDLTLRNRALCLSSELYSSHANSTTQFISDLGSKSVPITATCKYTP